jgi:acyl carrier protein
MNIEVQIRDYIARRLLFTKEFKYPDTTSFLEEGIVDSQGVMELVLYVEETFGLSIQDVEITPDNFDSVSKLADFIRRKAAQGAAAIAL